MRDAAPFHLRPQQGEGLLEPARPVRKNPLDGYEFVLHFGPQGNRRLDHGQRCRVRRGFSAADFSVGREHLGEALNDLIRLLQQFLGLGDGNARQGGRHVEEIAFVERRHELAAEPTERIDGHDEHDDGQQQRALAPSQHHADERVVHPDEEPAERVTRFGDEALRRQADEGDGGNQQPGDQAPFRQGHTRGAGHDDHSRWAGQDREPGPPALASRHERVERVFADEERHQYRHDGDCQHRRGRHGKGLGIRQRLEQASGLLLQAEYGQERHRNDQQAVEQGRTYSLGRLKHDLRVAFGVPVPFQVLVGILHHHHRGIHHHTDGNGNAAETHDVGVDPQGIHDQEGHENAHRQGDDGHQGRADVQQEENADRCDNGHFFDQLGLQGVNGPFDEVGAVVALNDFHAFWQALLQRPQFRLDVADDLKSVFAITHHHDAADGLAGAVPFQDAPPQLRALLNRGNVLQHHWRAHVVHRHDDLFQVFP